MLALLKMLDARMGEPSTYAGISAMLVALHVNVPAGVWGMVTLWGTVLAGAAAVALKEVGTKPPSQVASDAINALVTAVKAMPTPPTQGTPTP